jgi:predicted RecA/RadA family phage recombinase
MKNFIQAGSNLTLVAPYAVCGGNGVKIGTIFGIAVGSAANGGNVDIATHGVFELPKVAVDVMAVGDAIYWDDATKLVTKTASGNTKIGAAVSAAVNPSGRVNVRLNGAF